MAVSDPVPVRRMQGIWYVTLPEKATHWCIEVGFDGEEGELYLPSKESADACMKHFVIPYECGDI
jgi:hypothetical protein